MSASLYDDTQSDTAYAQSIWLRRANRETKMSHSRFASWLRPMTPSDEETRSHEV
jgi:hypothetical protein